MENIKFSVEAQRSFMHLPLEIPRNSDLSLSAKGMYSILCSFDKSLVSSIEELSDYTSSNVEEVRQCLNELYKAGYIDIKEKKGAKEYKLLKHSKKCTRQAKPKKMSRVDLINAEILKYDADEEVKEWLRRYFHYRISPSKDSRFYGTEIPYASQVKGMLNELDNIENKVESIKQSINKEYFKFFEVPGSKSRDNAEIHQMTQAEADKARIWSIENGEVY